MSLLHETVLKILPKTKSVYTVLTFYGHTKDNISSTPHKLQYNTGYAMKDNTAQHW